MAVKGAYWPSWSDSFPPSKIASNLFTHIYFAFLQPHSNTFELVVSGATGALMSSFTSTLHNNRMRTLISIGGGNASTSIFARMASSRTSRKAFIDSTIKVARTYNFDGLDLDWEYPKDSAEMGNWGLLLGEWRAALNREASASGKSRLLLTGAVHYSPKIMWDTPHTYPVESINQNMDWINVMCYDYYGSWTIPSKTGAHAALYHPSPDINLSTEYGLGRWIDAGVSVEKLVMGYPLYGRTWTLANANSHGIGAPANGVGPGEDGFIIFSEVETFNRTQRATIVHDEQTGTTYSYAGRTWISYNDEISAKAIIKYAKDLGLLGYFFWAVDGDNNWIVSREASRVWAN